MASKKKPQSDADELPFGAGTFESTSTSKAGTRRVARTRRAKSDDEAPDTAPAGGEPSEEEPGPRARAKAGKRTSTRSKAAEESPAREGREAEPAASEFEDDGPTHDRRPVARSAVETETEPEAAAAEAGERGPRRRRRSRGRGGRRAEGDGEAGARADERRPDAEAGDADARDTDAPRDAGRRGDGEGPVDPSAPPRRSGRSERRRRWQERRRRRRLGLPLDDLEPRRPGGGEERADGAERDDRVAVTERARRDQPERQRDERAEGRRDERHEGRRDGQRGGQREGARSGAELREVEGILVLEKGNFGVLRRREFEYLPSKDDVSVAPWQVQKLALREGSLVRGRYRRGQGRNKWELVDVESVDGKDPRELRNVPAFKSLTTIDPDFHYALGDGSGETSLKVVDVICPIGRGQRGLIVAPPRSGKTILLQQIAKAFETIYPDVHLMVLLVDERPEEATEWKRSVEKGEVFVSTNDEPARKHVELAEVVWRRARRLVELGTDVVLLLDSITRLGRAANNVWGNSGKTMSGGIDTRALERPKALFGSARNTEKAGSLTILGTTLVDTGSRMDQVIFEEFKGTGNMELVLSRKLADRRIFPAIDLERSGTRKDEKLHSAKRLQRCNTLRRVLMRMHFAEAMELLITKLDDVDKIDDFLQRFEVDPDAGDEGKTTVSPVRMRW